MKLSDLLYVTRSHSSVKIFKDKIKTDVDGFILKKRKKGSSISINFIVDMEALFLVEDCIKLCELYLQNILEENEIDYIFEGLLLSNFSKELEFEKGEELFDIIEELADPEINGKLTKERVEIVIKKLEKLKPLRGSFK